MRRRIINGGVIDDRLQKKEKIILDVGGYGITSVNKTIQPTSTIESNHETFEKDILNMFSKDFGVKYSASDFTNDTKEIKIKKGVILNG